MARGFQGMPGGNMQAMARQAQKLQQKMMETQAELEAREYEASAGGGVVTAKVNGKRELLALSIKPEAVDPEDVEMLEDTVMAAVNEALRLAAGKLRKRKWASSPAASTSPVCSDMAEVEAISKLVNQLSKLPGVGQKTAQRLAYHIHGPAGGAGAGVGGTAIFNGKKQVHLLPGLRQLHGRGPVSHVFRSQRGGLIPSCAW